MAAEYNTAVGEADALNGIGAKHYWDALLKKYNSDEGESLRASGTAEEYTEQDQLLHQLTTHYNDFKTNAKDESEKQKKKVRFSYFG